MFKNNSSTLSIVDKSLKKTKTKNLNIVAIYQLLAIQGSDTKLTSQL